MCRSKVISLCQAIFFIQILIVFNEKSRGFHSFLANPLSWSRDKWKLWKNLFEYIFFLLILALWQVLSQNICLSIDTVASYWSISCIMWVSDDACKNLDSCSLLGSNRWQISGKIYIYIYFQLNWLQLFSS
jgi:hypothetical protein